MTSRTPEQTAAWLDERLAALGIDQKVLARLSGVDRSNITKYKLHRQFPSARVAQQLAAALHTDLVTILVEFGVVDPDGPAVPNIEMRDDGGTITWVPR